MAQAPMNPLVAIVGATGTGKSDLAVEIARKFNGEIINGDAMQLYHGLPIITNKVSKDEMKGIPHHLLGCIGLEEETWTVGKFVGEALRVIQEIRSRGRIPILVGGTHYYTQALLFQDALASEPSLELDENSERFPILEASTEVILAKLQEVDPVMASRWHPNERRKIQRSLEIYLRTGKPASQVYGEQRLAREMSPSGSDVASNESRTGLRFPSLIFWVYASKEVLHPRLDGRIDKMLQNGLLSEVQELSTFRQSYETQRKSIIDQTRGIWVSIGYKEFLDYQSALIDSSRNEVELEKLKVAAIEKTQAATRQYANRQVKWIRTKLVHALSAANTKDNFFLLDGSDLSAWDNSVVDTATSITAQYLSGGALPDPTSLSGTAAEMLVPKREYDLSQRPDLWEKKVCETCGTVAVTENDWTLHVKSRAHRRMVGLKKKMDNEESAMGKKEGRERGKAQRDVIDVLEGYVQGAGDEDSKK